MIANISFENGQNCNKCECFLKIFKRSIHWIENKISINAYVRSYYEKTWKFSLKVAIFALLGVKNFKNQKGFDNYWI